MFAWWAWLSAGLVAAAASKPAQVLLSSHKQKCSAGGKPTSYSYSGCFKVSKVHNEIVYSGARKVTPDGCFAFCQEKWTKTVQQQFFGVAQGSKCWCGTLHEGAPMENCKTPCAGDEKKMCGGSSTASIYVMYDCTPPTKEEIAEAKADKEAKILGAYASFTKQSCGQADGNKLNINGGPTFVGSVDECKKVCYGSLECHGFTYDQSLTKCTFHPDVLDGKVKKGKKSSCFYKKLGLSQSRSLVRH